MLSRQCSHEFCMHVRRRLKSRQGAYLLTDQTIVSKDFPAGRALLQMQIQLCRFYVTILQFAVCRQQHLCLSTIHSSLTSCLYKLIKRSRARIKRIFTADALMFSIPAISAQDMPSFSYSHKQTAYLGGSCFMTRSTISQS